MQLPIKLESMIGGECFSIEDDKINHFPCPTIQDQVEKILLENQNYRYKDLIYYETKTINMQYATLIVDVNENEYDYKNHGDFKKYYDKGMKRNIWVLGYFGGGAVNIADAEFLAKDYAKENNVPYKNVKIDEIFKSRRFKGFKYMYSTDEQVIPDTEAEILDDVFKWLTD